MAIVIGVCLAVVFSILISITVLLSGAAIQRSVSNELTAISQANAQQVQQVFSAAATVADDIQSYLLRSYQIAEKDPVQMLMPTTEEAISMNQSEVYHRTLTSLNYDRELYMRESARNTAANNEDIEGVGVMFEPYAFQEDIRDYALYVQTAKANADVEPYGAYANFSKENFYKDAVDAGKPVVTDPYDYNGIRLVTYSTPIIYNSKVQGVAMADIALTNFDKVNSSSESYPSMYATVYDNTQLIIYDSESADDIGHNLSEFTPNQSELEAVKSNMAQGQAFQIPTTREDGRKIIRFYSPISAGSETWWSQTAVDQADMNKAVTRTAVWMVLLSVAALAFLLLVTVLVLRAMLKPLKPVVTAAEQIARGDLNVQLQSEQQDEIGALSRTFMAMTQTLKTIVTDIDYLLGAMAEGDFSIRTQAEESYVGDFAGIILSMRSLNRKLSTALGQINLAADQVSAGSDQVSAGAQALSQGATEQASSVEELAATINEISTQVQESAQRAQQGSDLASAAGETMEAGNRQMQEMITAMSEISEKSGQIGKIIKTIEDIAFQTNILALNAAVEAARAGTAGKGFAVVADEVRSLASKSAEASKSTAALIEDSIHAVEKGTQLAGETAQTLASVVESSRQVVEMVDGISVASNEQATSIAQVTQGIDQISSVVQTNSATAEESAAASEELNAQAQTLKELVSQFKLGDSERAGTPSSEKSDALPPDLAQAAPLYAGKY